MEAVMVVSLSTLLMLAITNSITNLYQVNSYSMAQSNEIDQARRGLQSWLDDAKKMNYADDGTFPVMVMNTHRLGFFSEVDGDPSVEYVEYFLVGNTLHKETYKASGYPPVYDFVDPVKTEILSEYVQNLDQGMATFSYFDSAGMELSTTSALLTDVRYLEIKVIVNIDPLRSPGEFLLRSGVTPRNLKDNL